MAIACRQDDDDQPQVQGPKDAKEFCLNLVDSLVSLASKDVAHVDSCGTLPKLEGRDMSIEIAKLGTVL